MAVIPPPSVQLKKHTHTHTSSSVENEALKIYGSRFSRADVHFLLFHSLLMGSKCRNHGPDAM